MGRIEDIRSELMDIFRDAERTTPAGQRPGWDADPADLSERAELMDYIATKTLKLGMTQALTDYLFGVFDGEGLRDLGDSELRRVARFVKRWPDVTPTRRR